MNSDKANKYTNYVDDYFISRNPSETTIVVNGYVTESWKFDGQFFNKITENNSVSVKIPVQTMTIEEYLDYVDELTKFKGFLLEPRPKLDIKKFK